MANFNNFNDIRRYIDEAISTSQLPERVKGTVKYSAPFTPSSYTKSIIPLTGDVWFNTSTNIYYEYSGASWLSKGNVIPEEGDYIYTENYIEEINTLLELAYPAQILWSKILGGSSLYWKIIRDRFYSPDEDTLGLNSLGRITIATPLLRNISNLSKDRLGHTEGFITLDSSSDEIKVTPSTSFLKNKGLQTLLAPDTGSSEAVTFDIKTFGGGSFKVGKQGTNNDAFVSLDIESGSYNNPVRKLLISTDVIGNKILWNQPQADSELHQNIGNGVVLVTDKDSVYPLTNLGRNIGKSTNKFGTVFTSKLNNGADLNIPTSGGTLARTTDIPSTLKNPYSLTVQLNAGSVEGTNKFTYDGSSAKTVNITPASIGASVEGHTHSYILKAGDQMSGALYHNSGSKSVWSYGVGETNKQGEINASSTSLIVSAVSNLGLYAGTSKVMLRTGTASDSNADGSIAPETNGVLNLGSSLYRWRTLYSNYGNINNDLTVGGNITLGGNNVATQTWVNSQGFIKSFTNNYLTGVSGSGNGTVTFTRNGLGNLTWDSSHYHDDRYYTETEVDNLLSNKLGTSQNAASASKLLNTRYLSISGGATGSSTGFDGSGNASIPITDIKEAYLSWGGKNHSAAYGPIDAAMVGELGANRLAFLPGESTIVEYSQDGGNTWLDYGCENYTKINIFNGIGSNLSIGKNISKGVDYSNFQLRIIINTATKVYSALNKFVILCSTLGSGGSWCTIDARLQSNYEANIDTWKMLSENTPINGWSGYNVINTQAFTTYGNTPTSQYGQIRLTFGCTTANLDYAGLQIIKIFGYGGVGWTTPSNLAKYGRMYTFDHNQNVAFPAGISAGGQNVVLNNDGRLSNARPASDVQPWAKALNKPTYTWNDITSKPTTLEGYGIKTEVDTLIETLGNTGSGSSAKLVPIMSWEKFGNEIYGMFSNLQGADNIGLKVGDLFYLEFTNLAETEIIHTFVGRLRTGRITDTVSDMSNLITWSITFDDYSDYMPGAYDAYITCGVIAGKLERVTLFKVMEEW